MRLATDSSKRGSPNPPLARRLFRAAVLLIAVLAPAVTRAAEVVIRLYDPEGRALINVDVTARLVESDPGNSERAPSAPFSPERWRLSSGVKAETDRSGAFTFPDLPPGVYALVLTARDDPFLLLPAADLRAPDALRITVPADQPRLEAPVVLRRGDLVLIDVTTNVAKRVLCSVTFREEATGNTVRTDPCFNLKTDALLPQGRWRINVEPPLGLVLVGADVDGRTTSLHDALFEVGEGGRRSFLTLRFESLCEVGGRLNWDKGDLPPGAVCARLQEAGPLLVAARELGADQAEAICFPSDKLGLWSGWLADGLWRLAPEGDGVAASEPPHVDFTCTPGGAASFSFDVRAIERDALGDKLRVEVLTPNGDSLAGAHVEVWRRSDVGKKDARPLDRGQTKGPYTPCVDFRRVASDDLTILAAHEEWGEGQTPARKVRSVKVKLQPGAAIEVHAAGPEGNPVEGVELSVDRLVRSDGEQPVNPDSKVEQLRLHRRVLTDATGIARVRGLPEAQFTVSGRLKGPDGARWLVEIEHEDDWSPEAKVDLRRGGAARLQARLVAAGSIAARLACDDGGRVPLKVDVRLLDPHDQTGWRAQLPVGEFDRTLFKGQAALAGAGLDELYVGPLRSGAYAVAVRPEGFERWSFAGKTDDPSRAVTLTVSAGQEVNLGDWTLDCLPSVLLVPRAAPHAAPFRPDISNAEVARAALAELRSPSPGAPPRELRAPAARPLLNAIRLYGLAPERQSLAITVRDRFLLPADAQPAQNPVSLEIPRGGEKVLDVMFTAPAGGIDLRADAPAMRIVAADGRGHHVVADPRIAGVLRAGPLAPGVYRIELCANPQCQQIARTYSDVLVEAGRVTQAPNEAR